MINIDYFILRLAIRYYIMLCMKIYYGYYDYDRCHLTSCQRGDDGVQCTESTD